jgi:tetratricopeptide (TPR) repeat protein
LVHADLGNYDKALELINKALLIKPGDAYYINNRGFIYLMQGKLTEALVDINRSIGIDPFNGWSYRNKGIYYLKNEKYNDAVSMLLQAEKMDPFIEKVNLYLGDAFLKAGDKSKACISYQKSLDRKEIDQKYYKVICQ